MLLEWSVKPYGDNLLRQCCMNGQTKKMEMKIGQSLILLLTIVSLLGLGVSTVSARGGVFVVKPTQEVIEDVNLGVSDEVFGNLSVTDGFIDFYVTSPSGVTLQSYHSIANTSFSFVADENGTYSMHLNNTYQTCDVTVTLDYAVHFKAVLQENINIGFSTGVAKVVSPPQPWPEPDDDPELDNLYERLLNFLKASEIVRTVRDCWRYAPIRNIILVTSCIGLTVGLIEIIRHRQHKYVFNTQRVRSRNIPV